MLPDCNHYSNNYSICYKCPNLELEIERLKVYIEKLKEDRALRDNCIAKLSGKAVWDLDLPVCEDDDL